MCAGADVQCAMQAKRFAVFALGNKTYEHFAATGKLVHKHLEALGGEPIVPVGVGDDDEDIEADFGVWLRTLLTAVQQASVFRQSDEPGGGTQKPFAYNVAILEDSSVHAAVEPRAGYLMGAGHASVPQLLPVQQVRELHGSQSERSCVHVELELGMNTFCTCIAHRCTAPQMPWPSTCIYCV